MEALIQAAITIVCSVLASSGLWAYLSARHEKHDAKGEMLMGLAHDRIMELGTYYIERGWITRDEYEDLAVYLYKPYSKLGGNGSAKHIMELVDHLPIKKERYRNETEQ